jgi:hypothetical protein
MDPEKQEEKNERPENQEDRRGMRRLVLTRSIVLGGEHAEEGSTHDVPRALAHRLIAEGSAVLHDSETPDVPAKTVTRMETPTDRDPKPRQVAPAPAKVKRGGK